MNISITSDLSKDGTVVTIEGKTIKNVHSIDFDMFSFYGPQEVSSSSDKEEPQFRFDVRIVTKETMSDGTEKCLIHNLSKSDNGEVKDSIEDATLKLNHLVHPIADMMLGKNRRSL